MHEDRFAGNEPLPNDESFGQEPLPSNHEANLVRAARHESSQKRGRHPFDNPNAETDESLFRRYQDGDDRAFMLLYERYKERIFAYCAQVIMSAGFSRDIAEDTFQDVFLRLTQYRHTFTGGEFNAWIFTVARHSCLTAKKVATKQRASTEYTSGDSFDDDTPMEVRVAFSHNDDPLDRMSRAEQVDLLQQAIAKLPEEFREALMMSEYDGLTYDEIAKITSTSLSTVRIRIYRAKNRLRKMLLPILGDQAAGIVGEALGEA
jgi:RNA polymerase sigma-70 factor (ECF subfamily)